MPGPTIHERATEAARAILHPQEVELRREVQEAQIALAQLAITHRPDLEGTGYYEQLNTLLHKAEALIDLAETLEATPTQIVPSPRKLWETPDAERGFFEKLSQGTVNFLRQAGDWLKTQGDKLEAGRCRSEARALLTEAGAILGGHFAAESASPGWANGALDRYRTALTALQDYQAKVREQSTCQQVEDRAKAIGEQLGESVNRENFRATIDTTGSSLRTSLIEFIAWGVRTTGSFALFVGVLSITLFMSLPAGSVLLASVLYVWKKYRPEVEAKMDAMAATDQPTTS